MFHDGAGGKRLVITKPSAARHRAIYVTAQLLVLSLVTSSFAPVGAAIDTYKRKNIRVQRVQMRARGYLNDPCVVARVDCRTRAGAFRPEATAQSIVIQQLSVMLDQQAVVTNTQEQIVAPSQVQWEVSPGPTDPLDPSDPEDVDPPELPEDPTCDISTPQKIRSWRADVAVDESDDPTVADASYQPGLLEVRAWSGTAPVDVDRRLECYVDKAPLYNGNLNFRRYDLLNHLRWGMGYFDRDGVRWCVWADPDPILHKGNIYFAPVSPHSNRVVAPDDVKRRIPLCRDADTPTGDPVPDVVPQPMEYLVWLAALLAAGAGMGYLGRVGGRLSPC